MTKQKVIFYTAKRYNTLRSQNSNDINACNYTDLEYKSKKLLEIGKGSFYFREYGATDILKDFSP